MVAGLNTDIKHAGRVYHVQTENRSRSEPLVETLIFQDGEVLVRMTAPYPEIAAQRDMTSAEARRALEQQHWQLVHKIRHGMLDVETVGAVLPATEPDPSRDPAIREILAALDRCIPDANVPGESTRDFEPPPRVQSWRHRCSDWLRSARRRRFVVVLSV